jgi:hypothetical protein
MQLNATAVQKLYLRQSISQMEKQKKITIYCGDTSPVGSKFNSNLKVNYSTRTFSNTLTHSRTGKIVVTVNRGNTSFDSGEIAQPGCESKSGKTVSEGECIECTSEISGFFAGNGVDEPYKICNWAQLSNVRDNMADSFILIRNLSDNTEDYVGLSDDFEPIGHGSGEDYTQFTGIFNGKNYTISNLVINKSADSYIGLFAFLGSGLEVSNIGLIDGSVSGSSNYVGGIAGYSRGTISNSYSAGHVSGDEYVGGIAGMSKWGTISNSYNTGSVSGTNSVGGIAGVSELATFSNSSWLTSTTDYAIGYHESSETYISTLAEMG